MAWLRESLMRAWRRLREQVVRQVDLGVFAVRRSFRGLRRLPRLGRRGFRIQAGDANEEGKAEHSAHH
jgi:hypothetical protein